MDQFPPPGPPLKFHLRLVSAIASLALLDVAAGAYCYRLVMEGDERGGVSGSAVFFGTEVSGSASEASDGELARSEERRRQGTRWGTRSKSREWEEIDHAMRRGPKTTSDVS